MGIEPRILQKFAIVNPYGGLWTEDVFDSPQEALEYLKKNLLPSCNVSEFSYIPCTVTIAVLSETKTVQSTPIKFK